MLDKIILQKHREKQVGITAEKLAGSPSGK
jgi:hypothetical protein